MFSPKCANTNCGAEFDYRRGRLFRIDLPHLDAVPDSGHLNAAHFWLCDRCSIKYTVEFAGDRPILVKVGSLASAGSGTTQESARARAVVNAGVK